MDNIKQKRMIITLDYDVTDESCNLFISQENTTGCKYNVKTINDFTEAVKNYIELYANDESGEYNDEDEEDW